MVKATTALAVAGGWLTGLVLWFDIVRPHRTRAAIDGLLDSEPSKREYTSMREWMVARYEVSGVERVLSNDMTWAQAQGGPAPAKNDEATR